MPLERAALGGREFVVLKDREQAVAFGLPGRQVLGGDHAVGAAAGLAALEQRAAVPLGQGDCGFQAFGADRVALVEQAVIQRAESDGDVGLAQQVALDAGVAVAGRAGGA